MSKRITTSVQSEGFEAVLYPGDGRKDKVMIVMSGSNGGMTLTKQEAEFYHVSAEDSRLCRRRDECGLLT